MWVSFFFLRAFEGFLTALPGFACGGASLFSEGWNSTFLAWWIFVRRKCLRCGTVKLHGESSLLGVRGTGKGRCRDICWMPSRLKVLTTGKDQQEREKNVGWRIWVAKKKSMIEIFRASASANERFCVKRTLTGIPEYSVTGSVRTLVYEGALTRFVSRTLSPLGFEWKTRFFLSRILLVLVRSPVIVSKVPWEFSAIRSIGSYQFFVWKYKIHRCVYFVSSEWNYVYDQINGCWFNSGSKGVIKVRKDGELIDCGGDGNLTWVSIILYLQNRCSQVSPGPLTPSRLGCVYLKCNPK